MFDDLERERRLLIDAIRDAFRDVSREDGVTLHEADVIDDYGTDEQRAAARALDTDRHWWEVPDHLIERSPSSLCFLDPKGLRYYLPAYMTWAIRHHDTSESASLDAVEFLLTPSDRPELADWQRERFELFDREQSGVIARYLRFKARVDGEPAELSCASQALESYWGRFCDDDDY